MPLTYGVASPNLAALLRERAVQCPVSLSVVAFGAPRQDSLAQNRFGQHAAGHVSFGPSVAGAKLVAVSGPLLPVLKRDPFYQV